MKSSASALQRSLKLRGHAASMRDAGTASERALWALLRGGQLGVCFRRQVVLHGRIVDFAAVAAVLVVEVDGAYHSVPARQRVDAWRDRRLGKAGWRVVRLPAELVLSQPAVARRLVLEAIAERGK